MTLLIWILFCHFVADFMCQTRKMAENKSSSNRWLSIHILTYTTVLWLLTLPTELGWSFAVINGLAHFVTDFCTSRISKRCYQRENVWGFWVTIGFDQFIHAATLLALANPG